jgi:hypothetical protein
MKRTQSNINGTSKSIPLKKQTQKKPQHGPVTSKQVNKQLEPKSVSVSEENVKAPSSNVRPIRMVWGYCKKESSPNVGRMFSYSEFVDVTPYQRVPDTFRWEPFATKLENVSTTYEGVTKTGSNAGRPFRVQKMNDGGQFVLGTFEYTDEIEEQEETDLT